MLLAAEYVYNNSTYMVTGVLPFYVYGINPKLVWDIRGDNPKEKAPTACKCTKQMIIIRELL